MLYRIGVIALIAGIFVLARGSIYMDGQGGLSVGQAALQALQRYSLVASRLRPPGYLPLPR